MSAPGGAASLEILEPSPAPTPIAPRALQGPRTGAAERPGASQPRDAAASTETGKPSAGESVDLPARPRRAGPSTAVAQESGRLPPGERRVPSTPTGTPLDPRPGSSPAPVTTAQGPATGLGLARLLIRLDGPRARVTDRAVEVVSGTLVSGAPSLLVLEVNGIVQEVALQGRTFRAPVDLRPGLNTLRAVATDRQGGETIDAITIEYVPPVGRGIAITSPPDGHTVGGDTPPLIVVEGRVDDPRVSTVWLVANERRVAVRASGGSFRHALPVLEPSVRLWAEAPVDGAAPHRSTSLTVHSTVSPTLGVVVLDWPVEAKGAHVEVLATWRGSADRPGGPLQTIPLKAVESDVNGTPASVFYLRNVKPGVYTFVLQYRAAGANGVVPTLYVPGASQLVARALRPVSLVGTGKITVARILMPQGVLWEQEDWFTGQSQTGETITKFRFPDGVSWTERKVDLQ